MSKSPVLYLNGERHRATHRASVISILGDEAPEVVSKGSRFLNVDRWTARMFILSMCDWAKINPGQIPTDEDIKVWVQESNQPSEYSRKIILASTPDQLPRRMLMALVGGAYHEAWHTVYSCRRALTYQEMIKIVKPRWKKIADWAPLTNVLLDWSNLIEDVRIERLGVRDYPGSWTKMNDLQDFVLNQEEWDTQPTILGDTVRVFREYGLGYSTPTVRQALARYEKRNSDAVWLVLEGPLRPLLDQAIGLGKKDELECLSIAMDILIEIHELASPEEVLEEIKAQDSAAQVLEEIFGGASLNVSHESALESGINRLWEKERDSFPREEAPYRPYDQSLDKVEVLGPSRAGQASDRMHTRILSNEVRKDTAFLAAKLRSLSFNGVGPIKSTSASGVVLASSTLVRSRIELESGPPTRPFESTDRDTQLSLACSIAIDESGSMRKHQKIAKKIVLTLLHALQSIGAQTFAFGFRDVKSDKPKLEGEPLKEAIKTRCHRIKGVHFDVLKTFEEPLAVSSWRLESLKCCGSTPMADGIFFALKTLSARPEAHKIAFIVTDGVPTQSTKVIKGLLSKAKKNNVTLLGVGIGTASKPVTTLFPDHVWSENLADLPSLIILKLTELARGTR